MIYDFPKYMTEEKMPDWPEAAGTIPATLAGGIRCDVPVLSGVNVLTFGVTGTGKTVSYTVPAARVLLETVPDMKGVFFEIKNTFTKAFLKAEDKVISYDASPFKQENVFEWCMIREIRQAKDKEAEMRQIAEYQFSDLLSTAEQNRGWIESARNAFIAVLRVIVDCYVDNPSNKTLITALRDMSLEELLQYISRHPRNHSLLKKDFGYDPENPMDYKEPKRARDIMFFFNQVLEKFGGTFESTGGDTIHDFLHTAGQNLFVVYDLKTAETSRSFISYFLKKIKDEKMSNTSDVRCPLLFCFDEVDKLADSGKSADFGLYQAATLGRESGIQILLTTQSFENLYGLSPQFNEHITNGGISGFPVVLSFRPGDSTTIETLQTLYGSSYREHVVMPVSRYGQAIVKYEKEPIVTDMDFASLDTGECYVKIKACLPQKVKFIYQSQ